MNFKEQVLVALVKLYREPINRERSYINGSLHRRIEFHELEKELKIKNVETPQFFQVIEELEALQYGTARTSGRTIHFRPTEKGLDRADYLMLPWYRKCFHDLKGDIRTIIVAALTVAAIKVIEWITALVGLTR